MNNFVGARWVCASRISDSQLRSGTEAWKIESPEIWAIFRLLLGVIELFGLLLNIMWDTFEVFGRKLRVGAPELQIDLKLGITGTRNRREKVCHKRGKYPWECPPPG